MLIKYIKKHEEITDILFTEGDPLTMNSRQLTRYLDPIVDEKISDSLTMDFK